MPTVTYPFFTGVSELVSAVEEPGAKGHDLLVEVVDEVLLCKLVVEHGGLGLKLGDAGGKQITIKG